MYHAIFGNFMPISQVSMGGNVITNFDSQILYSIGKNIVPILLLLVPLIVTILCLALRKLRVLTVRLKWRQALATLGILLTLLHLGIKNIRLGPTLPAFLSPNVLNYLVENFHIAPVTTPEEDLKVLLKR